MRHNGAVMADLPIKELGDEAPLYNRPFVETPKQPVLERRRRQAPGTIADALEKLLALARSLLQALGVGAVRSPHPRQHGAAPGGDAAVVRIEDGPKALALTTDVTPRYCEADPFEGGKQAVAEAYRNLIATGARPLAITDNLNFGNPERPDDHGPVRRLRARHFAPPAASSTSRSSPATSASTTRPTGAAFCRPRPSAASA